MPSLRPLAALAATLLLAPAAPSQARPSVQVIADDLVTPLGVEVDADGRVWVAEAGSGSDDGRVSVLVDGALQPVIGGFPLVGLDGEVDGAAHLLLTTDALWVGGGAEEDPGFDLLRFDRGALAPCTSVGAATRYRFRPRAATHGAYARPTGGRGSGPPTPA